MDLSPTGARPIAFPCLATVAQLLMVDGGGGGGGGWLDGAGPTASFPFPFFPPFWLLLVLLLLLLLAELLVFGGGGTLGVAGGGGPFVAVGEPGWISWPGFLCHPSF